VTETNQAPPRRLTRSADDRMLGGVCGGLAEYTGLDPVIFRVVVAVAAILGGAGLAAYLVAWLVIPAADGDSHAESFLRHRDLPKVVLVALGVVVFLIIASVDVGVFDGRGGGFPLLLLLGGGLWLWSRRDEPALPAAAPLPPPALGDAPVPPAAAPRRERSVLGTITLSAVLLALGILVTVEMSGAAEVDLATALAIGLVTVGGGLLVGSVYGRARWLIPLGIVLTIATSVASIADVPFRGGAGERYWAPTAAGELRPTYRLGVGEGELDLRSLDLDEDRTVEVTLGMGELLVHVPDDVDLVVDAHLGFGELVLLGDEDHGMDVDRHLERSGGRRRLELDLRVGMGRLEVTR
jgi:phage shock protein PspC (stress-responsive transcriptional regulator)